MRNRVLCLKIFQPFAQFRNPFTFNYAQSYPLPTKTAIIGMLQNATGRYYDPSFWDIKVSVHGAFESYFWNYQQLIKQGKNLKIELRLDDVGVRIYNQNRPLYYQKNFSSQRTPTYQQELFNGHYYLLLSGEEELIREIKEALFHPKKALYLGRSEDLIYLREVKELELQKIRNSSEVFLAFPTYLRATLPLKKSSFPIYHLPVKSIFLNHSRKGRQLIRDKSEIRENTFRESQFEPAIYTGFNTHIQLESPTDVEIYSLEGRKLYVLKEYGWF